MSSQPFLPLSDAQGSPRLRPRRPSLEPEREILSTRGQRIWSLLPDRESSTSLQDLEERASEYPTYVRRGSHLIGHRNARYDWCVHVDVKIVECKDHLPRGPFTARPPFDLSARQVLRSGALLEI